MNPVIQQPANSWDELLNIFIHILRDGASLAGLTMGQYTLIIFAVLVPVAIISLIASASIGQSVKRPARTFALVFLCVGLLCTFAAIGMILWGAVAGPTWAYESYG